MFSSRDFCPANNSLVNRSDYQQKQFNFVPLSAEIGIYLKALN